MARPVADITGQKFGYLVALRMNTRKVDENGKPLPVSWRCHCENCGNEVDVPVKQLRNSTNRSSCGCIKKQNKVVKPKITLAGMIKQAENAQQVDHYGRKWGRCPYPAPTCELSKKGWCCFDCHVKSCEDRCLNTPGEDKIKHCGVGRYKK